MTQVVVRKCFYFIFVFVWTICNQISNLKFVGLTVFFCLFFFKDVFLPLQRTCCTICCSGRVLVHFAKFFARWLPQGTSLKFFAMLPLFRIGTVALSCWPVFFWVSLDPWSFGMFCPQTGALWQCFAWLKNGFFFPPSWWPSRSMGTTC